ncbi:MAG: hypothetical protein LBT05_02725 [Planctomycetaceae bacterium]|nr:hypothetical protein [Planctomycetaceae bacterium]
MIAMLIFVMSCGKKQPYSLKIMCDEKFHTIINQLEKGFHEGFGVPITLLPFDANLVQKDVFTSYDLLLTDDSALTKRLCDNGILVETIDFCYATPILVLRNNERLSIKNIADLAVHSEKPLRLAVASEHSTLSELVRSGLEKNQVKTQGENVHVQFVSQNEQQNSDNRAKDKNEKQIKSQNLVFLLQQLKDNEIDMIACWDFDWSQKLKNSEFTKSSAESFWAIQFSHEPNITVPILLGITKDCTDYAICRAFFDFIKSNIGREIYKNNFENNASAVSR